jgi:hypothetical protein
MTTVPDPCADLPRLALLSAAALVSGELVRITHAPGWQRPPHWPLQATKSRGVITATGHRTNEYSPIHLLIYIDKAISRANKLRSKTKTDPQPETNA